MQTQPDVVTWRVVVSVLSLLVVTLVGMLYKLFIDRFTRVEDKLDGIIRYLVRHSEDGEQEDLARLIGRS